MILRMQTFGDVDIAFQVVDVEAPKQPRYQVENGTANVVPNPRLKRPREAFPGAVGQQITQNNAIVPVGLLHEAMQVLFGDHHGDARSRHRLRDLLRCEEWQQGACLIAPFTTNGTPTTTR